MKIHKTYLALDIISMILFFILGSVDLSKYSLTLAGVWETITLLQVVGRYLIYEFS